MVQIRGESIADLDHHGKISIAFEVSAVFDVELIASGLGGLILHERIIDDPWVKDYDVRNGGPSSWPSRLDVSRWGLLGAYENDRRIGGAVIAFDTPNLYRLRGRRDLAVLWDLRIARDFRRSGAGAALFRAAKAWAREHGCSAIEVETQQINVAACRFYAQMGCSLAAIDRFAYADSPEETQLIWRADLASM